MKVLILISALCFLAASASAKISNPVSCLLAAESDSHVLVATKARFKDHQNSAVMVENIAIALCVHATESYDPIACLLNAENDASVLAATKASVSGLESASNLIENAALKLCAGI